MGPSLRLATTVAVGVAVFLPAAPTWGRAGPTRAHSIADFAGKWRGTRYQWGGTSRSGIDCSAYLRRMYRDLFRVELPRTTRQQIGLGVDIAVDTGDLGRSLEPGDLIFYVDRTGTPNHVVVYMGGDRITHSVSGRGVVIEPLARVYGRRVVARRLLVPRSIRDGVGGDGPGFGPVPAAGPVMAVEVPCPSSFKARRAEVRRFRRQPIPDLRTLGPTRAICDLKALAAALRAKGGPAAADNARRLDGYAEWLDSIEALKGSIGRGW